MNSYSDQQIRVGFFLYDAVLRLKDTSFLQNYYCRKYFHISWNQYSVLLNTEMFRNNPNYSVSVNDYSSPTAKTFPSSWKKFSCHSSKIGQELHNKRRNFPSFGGINSGFKTVFLSALNTFRGQFFASGGNQSDLTKKFLILIWMNACVYVRSSSSIFSQCWQILACNIAPIYVYKHTRAFMFVYNIECLMKREQNIDVQKTK